MVGAGKPFGLHLCEVETTLRQRKPMTLGSLQKQRAGWGAASGAESFPVPFSSLHLPCFFCPSVPLNPVDTFSLSLSLAGTGM